MLDELNKEHDRLKYEVGMLHQEQDIIHRKILVYVDEIKIVQDKIAKLRLDGDEADIGYLLEENHGQLHYNAMRKMIEDLGLHSSGYFPETNQRSVSVMLKRRDPQSLNKTITSVKKVLPFIKPIKVPDADGTRDARTMKRLGIFEHTCSEHGIYEMLIGEEAGVFEIMRTRYRRPQILKSFSSLEEMLACVQREFYYED